MHTVEHWFHLWKKKVLKSTIDFAIKKYENEDYAKKREAYAGKKPEDKPDGLRTSKEVLEVAGLLETKGSRGPSYQDPDDVSCGRLG